MDYCRCALSTGRQSFKRLRGLDPGKSPSGLAELCYSGHPGEIIACPVNDGRNRVAIGWWRGYWNWPCLGPWSRASLSTTHHDCIHESSRHRGMGVGNDPRWDDDLRSWLGVTMARANADRIIDPYLEQWTPLTSRICSCRFADQFRPVISTVSAQSPLL